MKAATPSAITPEILELCRRINRKETPRYVSVLPAVGALINQCYFNVYDHNEAHGGGIVFGWIIWELAGVYVEAEHHALWQSDDGLLVDITPKADGEERILFLPQQSARFYLKKPNWRDNVRLAIGNDSRVASFVQACNICQRFELRHSRAKGRFREVVIPSHLVARYEILQRDRAFAYQKVVEFLNE